MMTKSDFAKLLKKLKIPVRYRAFRKGEAPQPPYAVYYQLGKDNFNADNQPYFTTESVTVELITNKKDETLESKFESLLSDNKLFFEFDNELELDSEGLYQVAYIVYLI